MTGRMEMMEGYNENELLITKYRKPASRLQWVSRTKLTEKLNRVFQYRLTVMTAPTGYGKTTAVLAWLNQNKAPVAWFSIDENDNDPVLFWRYFVLALREVLQDKAVHLADILPGGVRISHYAQVRLIINGISRISEKILIVLDDYHCIKNNTIHQSMACFLKNIPSNFSVMILTRHQMEPDYVNTCISGQMFRLNTRDLSFNTSEIEAFFRMKGYHLTPEQLEKVRQETEGWAAGLVGTAIALEEDKDFLIQGAGLPGVNYPIEHFLDKEVFEPWPDDIKSFLLCTAGVDRFSVSLSQALTDFENCHDILNRLLEYNHFIVPLDNEGKWYRYHHLFREFLINRLSEQDDVFVHRLYIKAGCWYRENGFLRNAIEMFLKGKDYPKAIEIFWELYNELVFTREYLILLQWMECIPKEFWDVIFCCARAWLSSMENRLLEAEAWGDKAERVFSLIKDTLKDDDTKNYLEAMVLLGQADLAVRTMDAGKAAMCYAKAAKLKLKEPILLGEANNGQPGFIRTFYGFFGRMEKVQEAYGKTREAMWSVIGVSSVYNELLFAECCYERDEVNTCYEILVKNFEKIYELNTGGALVPAFIILAKIKRAQKKREEAFHIIEEGKARLNGKCRNHWHYLFDLFIAEMHLTDGEVQKAEGLLELNHMGIYDELSSLREYEYIVFAKYLLMKNRTDEAVLLLNRLDCFAGKRNHVSSRIQILCIMGQAYRRQGKLKLAFDTLKRVLELGEEEKYIRTFMDESQPMADLLDDYLKQTGMEQENGITGYARSLLGCFSKEWEASRKQPETARNTAGRLTPKEWEVLKLIAQGRSNAEIADSLGITIRTVKYHNVNLFTKLGVKRRAEAIIKVRKDELLQ